MIDSVQRIIDAVNEYCNRLIVQKTPKAYLGSWVAAESVDNSLSKVDVNGIQWRYIPKLESVTGLAAGDKVLMVKFPGMPAMIHGVVLGDVTLATI